MDKILFIEDAPEYQLLIENTLGAKYQITAVESISAARKQVAMLSFDLIILDISLPDGNGFEYCAELRNDGRTRATPVIILTSRSSLTDKILGLTLGADDYIVKPFEALELRARVESKLLRARERREQTENLHKGHLVLDLASQKAYISEHGLREIGLTPLELRILYYLACNEGRVISRDRLLSAVWKDSTHVFDRATDKHISSLRQKLGDYSYYIKTITSVGYRFSLER